MEVAKLSSAKTATVDVENIVLLPMHISIISIEDDSPLNDQYPVQEIKDVYRSAISKILKEKKFNIQCLAEEKSGITSSCTLALLRYFHISDQTLPVDVSDSITAIGKEYGYPALLAISLKVKVGAGGTWNPYNGMITSGTSYSIVQAVLIDSRNESIFWKNKVLFRKVPSEVSTDLFDSSEMLFANLTKGVMK